MHTITTAPHASSQTSSATLHPSNLSADSLLQILNEVQPDILISTTSGGNFKLQARVIDCAIKASIPRFIPAEFGHDSLNLGIQDRLPPSRERARVIQYLRERAAEEKITWCGISTGYLLDHGLLSGDLGFDFKWQSATIHGKGDERFAASCTTWVGEAVSAAFQRWEEVKNQYVYVAEMAVSANEIVESVQKATGQHWELGYVDVEDTLREAETRMKRGFPDAGMLLMERSVFYDQSLHAVASFSDETTKDLLGLQSRSLSEVVRRVVHEYKHYGQGDCGCA